MPQQKFRLGLCLAGSVSAGAYSAGVLDYLFETLERWENAKADASQKNIPTHNAVVDVFSGASGGGMCGIISSIILQDNKPYASGKNSLLYKTWVDLNDNNEKLTWQQMLDNDDADKYKAVKSFINSKFIDDISNRVFDVKNITPKENDFRKWLSADLEVAVTVSNLRGIPYAVNFSSNHLNSQVRHYMVNHKLLLKFTTNYKTFENDKSYIYVNFKNNINTAFLKEAATATGAFPLGLLPRNFSLDRGMVDSMCFPNKRINILEQQNGMVLPKFIKPTWPDETIFEELIDPHRENKSFPYFKFTAVDGGMTNNEPFEVARAILLDKEPYCNTIESDGKLADRSILMIDPFPNSNAFAHQFKEPRTIPDLIKLLLKALRNQPLFKLEDIQLASEDEVLSRFMIAPTRNDAYKDAPIASASLDGFGGFLDKAFREHDFYLGRRNCQRFLNRRFGIPLQEGVSDNIILSQGYHAEAIERFKYKMKQKDAAGNIVEKWFVPIIPDTNVTGWSNAANDSIFTNEAVKYPFPKFDVSLLPQMRKKIWKRLQFVAAHTITTSVKKDIDADATTTEIKKKKINWLHVFFGALFIIPAIPFFLVLYFMAKQKVMSSIMNVVESDLRKRKIIK
jgi:Patatin-like phospholipase